MSDFELAMLNAFSQEFPLSQNKRGFFHFSQCIWRQVQAYELRQKYESDPEFAFKFYILATLAFVPVFEVVNAFEVLCASDVFTEDILPVVNYFEDTWIGRPTIRGCRAPIYTH